MLPGTVSCIGGGAQRHDEVMGTAGNGVPTWHCLCVRVGMTQFLLGEFADMTAIFAVVGERRDDPLELLLLGADGQHYAYPLPDGPVVPVEPDEAWRRDDAEPAVEDLIT